MKTVRAEGTWASYKLCYVHLKVKNVGQLAKSHIMYTDTEIEEAAADHFLSVITFSLVNYSKQDCVVLNTCV